MSDEDRDADWLLGLATLRAQHILRLVQLYEDGEIELDGALSDIRYSAQQILDSAAVKEPEDPEEKPE